MAEHTSKTLGKACPPDATRDAVHQAVAPVELSQPLNPGCPVKLNSKRQAEGCARGSTECVGIVDPYLTGKTKIGQRYWIFLLPGSISSLRHTWEHPRFPPEDGALLTPPPETATRAEKEAFAAAWNSRMLGYPPEGYHYICDQCPEDGISPDYDFPRASWDGEDEDEDSGEPDEFGN